MIIGIIGGTSFLGKHLIQRFSSLQNCSLKIWNRRSDSNQKINNHIYHTYNYPSSLLKIEDVITCDYIFYCAGVGVQPNQPFTISELYQLNLFEPIRLINSLIEHKFIGNIITFGSYFEIGVNKEELNFNETLLMSSTNAPLNEYGITKKILTSFVNQKVESKTTLNLSHFILPNIYGESENENRLIPYLVRQLKFGNPIQVGSATQIRQYLYINDIANFFRKLLKEGVMINGIYNLQGTDTKKIKEIIKVVLNYKMKKQLNLVSINFNEVQKSDSNAHYLGLKGNKANTDLGWNPTSKLEDVIPKYFNETNT